MPKPSVLVAEELSPAGIALLEESFDVRRADGSDRSQLLSALADVDALIVRSATKVDSEALAAAPKLQVVARAGVGLDNVDLDAATKAGVLVVNAPTSNIVSAAEQAINLLLASARHTAPAHNALVNGEWKRSKYTGVELYDKTIGVVGLGRIGALVAQRLASFGTRVVAYDPFVQPSRAAQMGVEVVSLDELLASSDFITIHLPKNKDTLGLIGDEALSKVKPNVRIINAARGGILDEDALYRALKEGRVAGAGIDVWTKEPCTDSPLFEFENVVVAPHLGASTEEAQEKAGTQVARSVRLALSGEFVPDAVNVQGGAVAEEIKPALPLTEKLGRIFTSLAQGVATQVEVVVRGDIAVHDVKVVELAALKGVFSDVTEDTVTFVNAPLLAKERGVEVTLSTSDDNSDWRNLVCVRGILPDGQRVSVSGTLTGPRHYEKLVEINGYEMEIPISSHMAFFSYDDRPGIVGKVGALLGEAQINIAGMQVSRDQQGGRALITLTVDSAIPDETLEVISGEIASARTRQVDLE
ncbi:D-3-phosphoglycerate dehydrogenase [Lipingzhangella halophila]|uniref:D-3-phosphoglycerate dehydrogenase n=1 Tax=Lipingzhangella halophila TaxID=1783352 RepID=A0A7W7RKJ3_9ACTN|nr:phosphoglycerate dehydrogenase [Lipingzhangella halophila]MBB4933635.1 D-3-phosphoglycerate dehydrogenase [Lipingzhangella halophila]